MKEPVAFVDIMAVLSGEAMAATDAALAPLAKRAQQLRKASILGTTLFFLVGLIAVGAGLSGAGSGWANAGILLLFAAIVVAGVQHLIREGRIWASWFPKATLPDEASALLHELRLGRRKVQVARGEEVTGTPNHVAPRLFDKRLGALILASRADWQGLAFSGWFGDDRLTVLFEDRNEPAAATPAGIAEIYFWPRERFIRLVELAFPDAEKNAVHLDYKDMALAINQVVIGSNAPTDVASVAKEAVAILARPVKFTWDEKAVRGLYSPIAKRLAAARATMEEQDSSEVPRDTLA